MSEMGVFVFRTWENGAGELTMRLIGDDGEAHELTERLTDEETRRVCGVLVAVIEGRPAVTP